MTSADTVEFGRLETEGSKEKVEDVQEGMETAPKGVENIGQAANLIRQGMSGAVTIGK